MNTDKPTPSPETIETITFNGSQEVFILLLTVLSLIVMVPIYLLPNTSPIYSILLAMDTIFCVFFMLDFFYQVVTRENRRQYLLRQGWLDFLGSLPALPILRLARLARLSRVVKIVQLMRQGNFLAQIWAKRAQYAFTVTLFIVLVVMTFGSIGILVLETSPESNITTAEDAIWWTLVTMTTVGYGDFFPVTTSGRMLAILVMSVGVGIFGVLTSFLASVFVADSEEEEAEAKQNFMMLQQELSDLKASLVRQEAMLTELRAQLASDKAPGST